MNLKTAMILPLLIMGFVGPAHAHTIDSVGQYRLEIGWMNEPVVSNETNAIELYISPLEPGLELKEQEFKNGVAGLEKTLKLELIYKTNKITLPLSTDHNVSGKYYAFVNPTISGFYQANILGNIFDTPISLSMHPPKVEERAYIEFPEPADITITQIIDGHTALIEDIHDLTESVDHLKQSATNPILEAGMIAGYVGLCLGIAGVAVAAVAIIRTRK